MPVRSADATWEGGLRGGNGTMRMASGAYEGRYSFGSRFEEGAGTNPEELIAAAHAGCFSMALSGNLERAGYTPERVSTTAREHLDPGESGVRLERIDLGPVAVVPGIDAATFREAADKAKKGCPVSQALGAVEQITLNARLAG